MKGGSKVLSNDTEMAKAVQPVLRSLLGEQAGIAEGPITITIGCGALGRQNARRWAGTGRAGLCETIGRDYGVAGCRGTVVEVRIRCSLRQARDWHNAVTPLWTAGRAADGSGRFP